MSPDQPNQTPTGADAESQDAPPGAAVRKTGLKRTRKGQTDPSGQTGQSGQSGQSGQQVAPAGAVCKGGIATLIRKGCGHRQGRP